MVAISHLLSCQSFCSQYLTMFRGQGAADNQLWQSRPSSPALRQTVEPHRQFPGFLTSISLKYRPGTDVRHCCPNDGSGNLTWEGKVRGGEGIGYEGPCLSRFPLPFARMRASRN